MKSNEAFELLDAVGVIESEKDGLFVAMVFPSYPYDKAEGCKLLIDHENITESTFNSLIDEAMSRGKRIEKLFHVVGKWPLFTRLVRTPKMRKSAEKY